jgi:cell division protein FtsW (lipid II flippase)
VQKFGFLPEQTTDMHRRYHREDSGSIGLLVLLSLYAALAWACFRIALNCKDLFGKLLATGITAIVIGQACINVGAALGVVPLTGVPLPLVSLGGTSMLVVLAGLGILLNIATNRRVTLPSALGGATVLLGGGTGGHLQPALAVAAERGPQRPRHRRRAVTVSASRRYRPR